MSEHMFSPMTFGDTKNTLGSFIATGTESSHWPGKGHQPVVEFQAERLLEAGYRIVYDPEIARAILAGRKR